MLNDGDKDVLLQFLEITGREWRDNYRAEDIRRDPLKIDALLGVNHLVATGLSVELLRERCPTFCAAYRDVMLRDVEELIPHGSAKT